MTLSYHNYNWTTLLYHYLLLQFNRVPCTTVSVLLLPQAVVQPSDSDEESKKEKDKKDKKDKKDAKVKAKAETKAVVLGSDEKAAKRKQLSDAGSKKKKHQDKKDKKDKNLKDAEVLGRTTGFSDGQVAPECAKFRSIYNLYIIQLLLAS